MDIKAEASPALEWNAVKQRGLAFHNRELNQNAGKC